MVAAREGQEARVGLPGGQGDGMDRLEGRMANALTQNQLIGVGFLRVELLGRLLSRLGGDQDLRMKGCLSLTMSAIISVLEVDKRC